jgi:hypothetical protein
VKECPVQLEAITRSMHAFVGEPRVHKFGGAASVEVEILRFTYTGIHQEARIASIQQSGDR